MLKAANSRGQRMGVVGERNQHKSYSAISGSKGGIYTFAKMAVSATEKILQYKQEAEHLLDIHGHA